MFDSNGYEKHPEGKLITEAYTRINANYKNDCHVKTILNPKKVFSITNPHFAFYKWGKLPVDENFKKNKKEHHTENFSNNKIQLNHYYSKSLEDYERKNSRGYATRLAKRQAVMEWVNFKETDFNYSIQRFVPELKKRMEKI